MGYVFVSYSFRDSELVKQVVSDLRKAGIEVWFDAQEVKPGMDWGQAIEQALNQADGVLLIQSGDSRRSPYLQADVKSAQDRSVPVFGFVITDGGMKQMLPDLEYLDARREKYPDALRKLVERLPDSVQSSKPVKPQAPKSKGYVFISYAQEDTEFVEHIRQFLKERGYGYWDYQDSDRNYQTQLFLELEEVIKGAAATLSVLSPDWKKSQWAAKEYLFSQEVGVPVFLLMAREMGPTLVTAGYTYIDFSRDMDAGFGKLDKELRRKGLIE